MLLGTSVCDTHWSKDKRDKKSTGATGAQRAQIKKWGDEHSGRMFGKALNGYYIGVLLSILGRLGWGNSGLTPDSTEKSI